MRRTIKATAVALAALGMIGLISSPASAEGRVVLEKGSDERINVYYYPPNNGERDYGGYVKFVHNGDHFYLKRETSPGNRIYLEYDKKGGVDYDYRLDGGYEDESYVHYNRDLPEGTVYEFVGCIQVDDDPDYCSGYQHFTA